MYRKQPFILLFIFPFFVGCVSLNEVHEYTSSSVKALNKVNSLDYTFTDYCNQDCELQQLRLGEIKKNFSCNCTQTAANADSAIGKIHSTITTYLQAVAQLSNNSDFNYDVSGLTQAVQGNPLLRLNDQQISVATKAGNFLTTAVTTYYRRKHLKQYLGKADSVFQELTATFIYLIDNRLRAQLKFEYDARLPNIKQMLDNTNDKGLKQILVKMYLDETAYYKRHNALIDSYTALLTSVQKGYHELYIHRNNLNDINTKQLLKHYNNDLQYILKSVK